MIITLEYCELIILGHPTPSSADNFWSFCVLWRYQFHLVIAFLGIISASTQSTSILIDLADGKFAVIAANIWKLCMPNWDTFAWLYGYVYLVIKMFKWPQKWNHLVTICMCLPEHRAPFSLREKVSLRPWESVCMCSSASMHIVNLSVQHMLIIINILVLFVRQCWFKELLVQARRLKCISR